MCGFIGIAFGFVSTGLRCFLRLSSAGLVVVLLPGCWSAFSVQHCPSIRQQSASQFDAPGQYTNGRRHRHNGCARLAATHILVLADLDAVRPRRGANLQSETRNCGLLCRDGVQLPVAACRPHGELAWSPLHHQMPMLILQMPTLLKAVHGQPNQTSTYT